MADHQPDLGAQHRDMVASGFRIGRADADVDQRNPGPALRHQVIGGHLVAAPLPGRDLRLGIVQLAGFVDVRRVPTAR